MRLFNAKIIDRHLEGDGAGVESSDGWACLLARAESLKFLCVVDEVSNAPTLTIDFYGALADVSSPELTKRLVSQPVSGPTTIAATFTAQDSGFPPPRHLFVVASIAGAGGVAHLRVWACGRGPQLLEATPAAQATFASQLVAARMVADEDRLPGQKRLLKQGASLFYPPELWEPSLKWER